MATVNTTKAVFKDSKISDAELASKAMKENTNLVKNKRVPFKCEVAYNALYPNGFESTCQGIYIFLIFDGRTVELPDFIADYVRAKIEKKALATLDKKHRNTTKKQDYLGMEYVG
jgi:hypothetical protein|nr:MAG TPA: hypothetical protein [Caudoviricetes sp.]